jgi:DmsE family decaheme c-type cytochrome
MTRLADGKRIDRRPFIFTLLLLLLALATLSADETCSPCHAGYVTSSPATAHDRPGRSSCASCHGGTAAHLSSPARGNIFNPATAAAAQSDASCLGCHAALVPAARWKNNHHARAGLACVSCHRIHPPAAKAGATAPPARALLRAPSESETCYGCHPAVRRAQLQRSTHILPDDHRGARMECSECHDVHASSGDRMLRAPRVNALCLTCHDEKRGPFLWEHSPVRDNCLSCHTAHGSNNTHLLTMRAPMLCQSCHAGDVHTTLAPSSSSAWLAGRSCVNCHQMVHGSNHPSGVTLQR